MDEKKHVLKIRGLNVSFKTSAGVVNAVRSFELRTYHGNTWVLGLVVSVIVAVGGVVIIVNPFDTTVTFMLVLGILLIVKGVGDLIIEASLSSALKNQR